MYAAAVLWACRSANRWDPQHGSAARVQRTRHADAAIPLLLTGSEVGRAPTRWVGERWLMMRAHVRARSEGAELWCALTLSRIWRDLAAIVAEIVGEI